MIYLLFLTFSHPYGSAVQSYNKENISKNCLILGSTQFWITIVSWYWTKERSLSLILQRLDSLLFSIFVKAVHLVIKYCKMDIYLAFSRHLLFHLHAIQSSYLHIFLPLNKFPGCHAYIGYNYFSAATVVTQNSSY